MNRNNSALRRKKLLKILYSLAGLVIIVAGFKLFTFSLTEAQSDEQHQQTFNSKYQIFALNIPENLNFAEEPVPIENFEVRERFDRELLINTYWQSQTLLSIKRANRWFPVIESILKRHEVPDDFKYLALIESGFMHVVSPAGATGFWQFMEPAGKKYGLEINNQVDERYNVERATAAACSYLKDAYKAFGSWTLAAAAYNAGFDGIQKQLNRQKVKNYYDLLLTEETSRYMFRILAAKEIMSNPRKYGFHFRKKDLYPQLETYTVDIDTSVSHFADFAARFGINYKTLKVYNPWLRDNFLNNKEGKVYTIKLPKEGFGDNIINTESIFEFDDGQGLLPDTDTLNALPADTADVDRASAE